MVLDDVIGPKRETELKYSNLLESLEIIVAENPYTPAITWGLNLAAIYKNWTARVDFYGISSTSYPMRQGGMFFLYPFSQNKDNALEAQANRWTPINRNAQWPAVHSLATNQYNYQGNEFSIIDGKYTRLKNVAIGYKLEADALKKVGLSKVDFILTGTNLLTWTPGFKLGGDPEGFNSGVDFGAYPMMKRFTLEVRLTF